MKNRLDLDFTLETNTLRKKYIDSYLPTLTFNLTRKEKETIANYILWGKDKDGLSPVKKGEIEIETSHSTWSSKKPDSLNELLEDPNFNENSIHKKEISHEKQIKKKFNREEVLAKASPALKQNFLDLFSQIDKLDLLINFYELNIGKRKNPPRKELLNKFTIEEQERIKEKSTKLNSFIYLKKRHLLVDLRRQQFAMRDLIIGEIQKNVNKENNLTFEQVDLGIEIPVYPCGTINEHSNLPIFEINKIPYIEVPTQKQLNEIETIKLIKQDKGFDFTNENHLLQLINMYDDFKEKIEREQEKDEGNSNLSNFIRTFNFYIHKADLSPIHTTILQMKIDKCSNQEIREVLIDKFDKVYNVNYISTIYRQKILKQISEAAALHREEFDNILNSKKFKKCNCCGKILLINRKNFVLKEKSRDGFSNRCKKCDKQKRQQ